MVETVASPGVENKARRLAFHGGVELVEDGVHSVQGDTGTYLVEDGVCPCDSFKYRAFCSHEKAVVIFEELRAQDMASTRRKIAEIEDERERLEDVRKNLEKELHELETPKAELERQRARAEAIARREAERLAEEARKRANGEYLDFDFGL